jgi:hypothetical protein
MREKHITRRVSLQLLVGAPIAAAILSACGKKTEPDSCQDVSALSDAEKTGRTALQYTDKSPQADKHCSACNFWQPNSDPAQCGGCKLVKGPIHPKGYCTAFAPKTTT